MARSSLFHSELDEPATAGAAQPSQQSIAVIGPGVVEQPVKIIATVTRHSQCQCGHHRRKPRKSIPSLDLEIGIIYRINNAVLVYCILLDMLANQVR